VGAGVGVGEGVADGLGVGATDASTDGDGVGAADGGVLPIPATNPGLAGAELEGPMAPPATTPIVSPPTIASMARPMTAARFIVRGLNGGASGGPSVDAAADRALAQDTTGWRCLASRRADTTLRDGPVAAR
jgi:hypothetical protein